MNNKMQSYNLHTFIKDMTDVVENNQDDAAKVQKAEDLVSQLIQNKSWLPKDIIKNNKEEQYARHSLYRDPADRFEILELIWEPGQKTPLHDHDGTWG